jgi:ADP-ribose pyrophosphatase
LAAAPNPRDTHLDSRSGDHPSSVHLSGPERLGGGFRSYDRFTISRDDRNGDPVGFDREVLRSGPVVGVLPIDTARGQIVLTRQFRLGGHLANGRGEMIEIVAGRIDPGEQPEDAARRECHEEIGVHPLSLTPLFSFAPAPALSDEFMTLFLADIDASAVPKWAGMPDENEEIAVIRYTASEALGLLRLGTLHSGPTIIALQWLAQNRHVLIPGTSQPMPTSAA